MLKTLQFFIVLILTTSCFLSVSCQTKEEKVASVLKQCQTLLDKDDLDKATTCYADAVLANPNDYAEISLTGKKALFNKCSEYRENKNYEKAIVCYEGYTAVDENFSNAYFLLSSCYLDFYKEKKKSSKANNDDLLILAEEAIRKGLMINPEDAHPHTLYGEILKEQNEDEKALYEYNKAVKLAPNKGIYFVRMAFIYEKLGQSEAAIESYKKALAINPNDDVALWFLGMLYNKQGRCSESIEAIEKSIKIEPTSDYNMQQLETVKKNCKMNNTPKKKAKAVGEDENVGSGIVVKP